MSTIPKVLYPNEKAIPHTLSFQLLDDLIPHISKSWEIYTEADIKRVLRNLWKEFDDEELDDVSGYYFQMNSKNKRIEEITNSLISDGYYVRNRFEKYYVIAFAIDYKRFNIWSKDCDAKMIKWREDDEKDKIDDYLPSDYDVNPVVKLLQSIECGKTQVYVDDNNVYTIEN